MKKIILKLYNYLASDSLYSNSIYLMLSTAVMGVFGFFFWIITARLYSTKQVGVGVTLISTMALISKFSFLGLGNGLIRYLPGSETKNEKINTSLTIAALMSFLMSIFYLFFLNIFSPKLLFVRENIIFSFFFILFIIFFTLSKISEHIFIAFRSSYIILIINTITSVVKLILPILLVGLGAYGIFMATGIAMTISFLIGLAFLVLRFNYFPELMINRIIVNKMIRFSLGNYAAEFISELPIMILPIIITHLLGAEFSAYFFMSMQIASLLYIIPIAVSQSLFAEGSRSEKELKVNFKKATNMISLLLSFAILGTFMFGKYILFAFGNEYSNEGIFLLKMLALSGIFLSINYVGKAIFYIKYKIRTIILVNCIGTSIILILSIVFIHQNLIGIGLAWIIGQGTISLIYLYLLFIKKII